MSRKRTSILGHPTTRVLNWMGKNGFTFAQAKKAVNNLCSGSVADSTIGTGLSDGKNPKYSKPVSLTADQEKQLRDAAGLADSVHGSGCSVPQAIPQTIRIDPEVWLALQKVAVPFIETPNDVLRRLLRLGNR
jgi:hypothetical protein